MVLPFPTTKRPDLSHPSWNECWHLQEMWDLAVQKTRHSTGYRISLSGCLERVKGEFFKVFSL